MMAFSHRTPRVMLAVWLALSLVVCTWASWLVART
jgi:hypothetical protein